jgi:hypothetical protein
LRHRATSEGQDENGGKEVDAHECAKDDIHEKHAVGDPYSPDLRYLPEEHGPAAQRDKSHVGDECPPWRRVVTCTAVEELRLWDWLAGETVTAC